MALGGKSCEPEARPPEDPQRAAPPAACCLLTIPNGAINPMTGGGQRSALLFEGLKRLGQVTVVILGVSRHTRAGAFFPGAERVIGIPLKSFELVERNALKRTFRAAVRLLFPTSSFAVVPSLRAELTRLIAREREAGAPVIVAFRYFRTMARSGVVADPAGNLFVVVDMDDRDDGKAMTQLRARFGPALGGLLAALVGPRVLRSMSERLRGASLVMVAKPDDLVAHDDLRQTVIPNVPRSVPGDVRAHPAGSGTSLLFVGSAENTPNRKAVDWFLETCWHRIRSAVPDAEFRIVGIGDWQALIDKHGHKDGVVFVGYRADVAPEYRAARAAVSPVFEGAGSQIKVIEACGHGRPVVASRLTGSGFGREIERLIRPVDAADAFSEACIRYLTDATLATEVGLRLRELQQAQLSRHSVVDRIAEQVRAVAIPEMRALS